MRKLKVLFASLMMFVFTMNAQENHPPMPKEKKERIEAMKVAFITKKLELTSNEAEKFWPVYNELQSKRHNLMTKSKENHKALKEKGDRANDDDIEKVFNEDMALKEQAIAIEKEYFQKLKAVLPMKKLALLHQSEREFKKEMLRNLKHGEKPPMMKGRPE